MSTLKTILLSLWVICLISGAWGLFEYRDWAIKNLSDETINSEGKTNQEEWDNYLDEMKKQNQPTFDSEGKLKSPVNRSTSRQAENPTLLLMRDNFGMCLSAWLIFGSILYWMLALATVATFTPSPPINTEE